MSYELVEGLTFEEYLVAHAGEEVTVDAPAAVRPTVSSCVVGDAIKALVLMVPTVLGAPVLRRLYNRWGTTKGESVATMPGDELIARPDLTSTRAAAAAPRPTACERAARRAHRLALP